MDERLCEVVGIILFYSIIIEYLFINYILLILNSILKLLIHFQLIYDEHTLYFFLANSDRPLGLTPIS